MQTKILFTVAALFIASLLGSDAKAQTVLRQPSFAATNSWVDLGNGPTEVLPIEGSGSVYTAMSTGVGSTSGAATLLTLTAIPAVLPCVGCNITGSGLTTQTVSAVNGSLLTLSAVATVPASSALAWGAACPTSGGPASPSTTNPIGAPLNLRATAGPVSGTATPIYSQARVCMYGGQQQGLTFVNFAIGAW